MYMCSSAIVMYVVLNMLREGLQFYQQRWQYLLDPTNLVSWLLYVSTIIMIMPVYHGNVNELQVSCASITVFLCWFTLLLNLQRYYKILLKLISLCMVISRLRFWKTMLVVFFKCIYEFTIIQ